MGVAVVSVGRVVHGLHGNTGHRGVQRLAPAILEHQLDSHRLPSTRGCVRPISIRCSPPGASVAEPPGGS